jgi:integrase
LISEILGAAVKIRLTKRSVDAFTLPAGGEVVVWDAELRGFGVRVSPTGRRTYFVRKRTKAARQVRVTLGVHGEVTAEQARAAAVRVLGRIADGADPAEERHRARAAEEKRRNTLTVAGLADKFLAEHAEVHCRPRTAAEYRALIERIIKPKLGAIKVPDLEHDDVAKLHRDLAKTPYVANRVLAVLSKMFSLAIVWKMRPDHPVKGVVRYQEEKRQRFLSVAELGRLGQALAEHPYKISANAIRMLLLTGARRGEVLAMEWSQVETEPGIWIKPAALTKQKKLHRVPLSPGARQLLADMQKYRKPDEVYVFPGRGPGEHLAEIKKSWVAVCKAAGVGSARIHDLRHSYASVLASSGLSLPVIGALLGHTQPQTTARYAHLADDPLQEATNRVDALLTALAGDRKVEVAPLRKRPS